MECVRNSRCCWAALALAAMLALEACATRPPRAPGVEEVVAARAQQRWNKLLEGDLDGAYQFLSPGRRSAISSLDYQRSILSARVRWTGAEVSGAECADETCNVRVRLGLRVVSPVPGVSVFETNQTIDESWIEAENQWWFVPR